MKLILYPDDILFKKCKPIHNVGPKEYKTYSGRKIASVNQSIVSKMLEIIKNMMARD